MKTLRIRFDERSKKVVVDDIVTLVEFLNLVTETTEDQPNTDREDIIVRGDCEQ